MGVGVEAKTEDEIKKLNKNKKLVKKLANSYSAFIASDSLTPRLHSICGPWLNKAGKQPAVFKSSENLLKKIEAVRSTIKFQLKKVLCMGVAVGNVSMDKEQIRSNIQR